MLCAYKVVGHGKVIGGGLRPVGVVLGAVYGDQEVLEAHGDNLEAPNLGNGGCWS